MQNADCHDLYRFYADQYRYWLYTTNPQDIQEREATFQWEREKTPNATHGELMARACRALAGQRRKASYAKAPGVFGKHVIALALLHDRPSLQACHAEACAEGKSANRS